MFKAKRARYDVRETLPALGFCLISRPFLRASYEVSLIIAKAPHRVGEKLIEPSAVKMAQILLGRNEAKRIGSVPLSHSTVNKKISDIAHNILSQLIAQIQDSPGRISLQFDKTTDIKSISQFVAYVRFVKENAILDQFLFCQEMKERTRAKDVFDPINGFLRENSIAWNKVGSVCIDGALTIIQHRSSFLALMKQVAPHIISNHCAIHKYAIACKTLPLELKSVLDSVVKAVNFICGRAVNCPNYSKHFATTLKRSITTFFSTPKCDGYRGENCSPVLQNLSLKLPCFFVSMGQWNLLHYLMTIDSN